MIGTPLGGWSVGGDAAVSWGLGAPRALIVPLDVVISVHPELDVLISVRQAILVTVVVSCGAKMLPGNVAKIRCRFVDCDTKLDVDPLAVRMILDLPGAAPNTGTLSTYGGALGTSSYFTILAFTKESVGHYLVTVLIPSTGYMPGRYASRWEGDGSVSILGAGEGFFDVEASKVVA